MLAKSLMNQSLEMVCNYNRGLKCGTFIIWIQDKGFAFGQMSVCVWGCMWVSSMVWHGEVDCMGTGNGIVVGCLPVSSGVFRKENDHWFLDLVWEFKLKIGLKYIFPSCWCKQAPTPIPAPTPFPLPCHTTLLTHAPKQTHTHKSKSKSLLLIPFHKSILFGAPV